MRLKPSGSPHPLDDLGLGALPQLLSPDLVDQVIADCGRRDRRVRALPARVTLYFVLALWLCPAAGPEVLRMLFQQLKEQLRAGALRIPATAAAVQACRRLGPAPLRALFRRLRGPHGDPGAPGMSAFGCDLALLKVSVDGTRLDVADTPANRKAFGAPPRGRFGSGRYPQIRVLMLIASGTRAVLEAVWGPWSVGELPLLDKLMQTGAVRRVMLVLADRYFTGFPQVSQIVRTGAHLIFRTPSRRKLPVFTELPDGSYLSVLPGPVYSVKGDWRRSARERGRRLGLRARQEQGIRIRVIEAEVTVIPEHGEPRTESYRLITTLLDPKQAPAEQIARLYAERWEAEIAFADLKTYLRSHQKVLRSKDPQGVAQELYALLIVYQLVQITRARAARTYPHAEALDPDRISFTVTLRALVRTIGRTAPPARLLHDALREIHAHPLLTRRPRAKPRERKGTVALAKAITTRPPSKVEYKITTRAPRGN
ncbi:IS4 family transposase [Streptomyces sp. TRM72054]|uniref:IS4 family transposase n=1 Tax=Streptomyces sp. TRM72054 TaxID=2870562 RepID=UPI0027E119AF|nr:IS4 family transposase [Streptomyces sp. TRM72054]